MCCDMQGYEVSADKKACCLPVNKTNDGNCCKAENVISPDGENCVPPCTTPMK